MTHSHLTRWIEDAEARNIALQGAMPHPTLEIQQSQYLHLGSTIAKVSSWLHHHITRDVLAYMFEPPSPTKH